MVARILTFYLIALIINTSAQVSSSNIANLHGNGMCFTPNKGQIIDIDKKLCPDVLYKGEGAGANIYLRKTGISYVYNNISEIMHNVDEQVEKSDKLKSINEKDKKDELLKKEIIKLHRVDMDFAGCQTNTLITNENEVDGYQNFYYANCPNGITNVKQYNKVTYKNIYNNIDVSYYGSKQAGIKYDIIVQPHADPNQIKLSWKGAEELKIRSGKLVIKTSVNEFSESIPKVYQNINGKIVDVNAEYIIHSPSEREVTGENCVTTFKLGIYNHEFPLIIDPWVTYYGGSNSDYGSAIATDNTGNVVVTGYTTSADFPVLPGGYTQAYGGNINAFILKFDQAGTRIWATYYGGSSQDYGYGIATDFAGNIFISGSTNSINFPVMSGFQMTNAGGDGDAFVIKLAPSGALQWASYYGGTLKDASLSIVTDFAGNVILTGNTHSVDFPITTGAFQTAYAGTVNTGMLGGDVFVVKLNSTGIRLWSTYYGGSDDDMGIGIAVDNAGSIAVTGLTSSIDFPVSSAGGYTQPSRGNDAFVIKFNAVGACLWSTYYGGTSLDEGWGVAIDNGGNIIITGVTLCSDFPVSAGAFQTTFTAAGGLPSNAFVVKFDAKGNRLWATYLGGSASQWAWDIATDLNNNIYVYGDFEDEGPGDYPIPACAYQPVFGGGPGSQQEDNFIAKYNSDGFQLCMTYLGGTGEDEHDNLAGGIAVHGNSLYITGATTGGYPVTTGAFQTSMSGSANAFIDQLCTNICEPQILGLNFTANNVTSCANTLITFAAAINNSCDTSGYKFQWTFTGGTPSSSTKLNPGIIYSTAGSYPVKLVVTTACKKDSITQPAYININNCTCVMSAIAGVTSNVSCSGASDGSATVTIGSGSGGSYTYNWSNGVSGATTSATIPLTGLSANTYTITITDGSCSSVSTFTILPSNTLSINQINSTNACYGKNNGSAAATISSSISGPYTYSWSTGLNTITNSLNNSVANLSAGTYTVTLTQGSCITTSTVTLPQPVPWVTSVSQQWSCSNNKGAATSFSGNGNSPYSYLWSNSQTTATATNLILGTTYTVTTTDAFGCSITNAVTVATYQMAIDTGSTNNSCTTTGSATAIGWGFPSYTYNWNSGQTTSTISGLLAGTYIVTITDGNGCVQNRTFNISGVNPVSATFNQSSNGTICTGTTVSFFNTGSTDAGATNSWLISPTYPLVSGATIDFSNNFLSAGLYSVIHKITSGGCTATVTSIITAINCSAPTVTASSSSICQGSCAVVAASPIGGTGSYTYLWSTGEITSNINPCPTATTTYTLTITDASSNTATTTATVTVNPTVSITTTATNIKCFGNTNGSAITNVSTGTGPFTYNWNTGLMAQTISGLGIGNYTVTVTDNKGCTSTSTAAITQPLAVTTNINTIPASCNTSTGSAYVTPGGGTPAFSYNWSPGGITAQTISAVAAGSYTVTVTDANNCTKTDIAAIGNSPSPTINSLTKNDLLCNGNNSGSATVAASGGSGALTYSWSNSASGATSITGLSAGLYIVTVTDASGCRAVNTIGITEPSAITANASAIAATCGAANGSVSVSAGGGTGSLSYSWSSVGGTAQTVNNIAASGYTVTVKDANGCSKTATTTVINTGGGIASASIQSNVNCNGASTGSATASIAGGTSAFTYLWSNGISSSTTSLQMAIGNLTVGNYSVTITDANGCISSSAITITEPPVLVINPITSTNASCGSNNGSATATAVGGNGTLTYSWNTNATGQTISSLGAATYSLTVTDGNGCTKTQNVSISNSPAPVINSLNPVDVLCKGSATGAATVSATGAATLTYSWSSPGGTAQTISGLAAATYTVSVTDGNGCTIITNVTVTEPASAITGNVTATDASCGQSNGSATANASGGTGALTYNWSNSVSGQTINNLSAANYTVSVSDANGCVQTSVTTINNSIGPVAIAGINNPVLCNGDKGSIVVSTASGSSPLTYSWSNSTTSITNSINQQINNLSANIYSVTITDANGCTSSSSVNLSEPTAIIINPISITNAACGSSNGSAIASATDGTGTLTYSWDNNVSGATNNAIPAGSYIVIVTDGNSCTKTATAVVNNNGAPTISLITPVDELCNGANTGSVSVTIAGGSSPYTYNWSNSTSSVTTNLSSQISGLTSTTYSVTITDANNCQAVTNVLVAEPSAVSIPTFIKTDATCGAANGSALASAGGGTGMLTYAWSNAASGATNNNLLPANYNVTVTDVNSCSNTSSITINNSNGPAAVTSVVTAIACNGGTGSVKVITTGGSSPYTYSWSSGISSVTTNLISQISSLTSQIYSVTITDANGCTVMSSVDLIQPAAVSIPTFLINDAACGQSNGSAIASAVGGTGSLTFTWNNFVSGATNATISSGNYTVTVSDANACLQTATATVNNINGPIATTSIPVAITCNGGTGSVSVSIVGGGSPYTYSWSNNISSTTNALSSQISSLTSQIYFVTVTDMNGCIAMSSIDLTEPLAINPASFTTTSPGCLTSNGSATAVTSGGTGTLTYTWSNGDIGQTASNLSAGIYSVTITDQNSCSLIQSTPVNNNPIPSISSISSTNVLCNGNSTGAASVSAIGSGTLTYNWSNTVTGSTVSGLLAATYSVTVTDQNGCQAIGSVVITEPPAIASPSFVTNNAACGQSNGSAIASAVGGTGSLSYSWSNFVNGATNNNIPAGNYIVTITDANGCTKTAATIVNNNGGPTISSTTPVDELCNGANTGLASVTISGGNSPYTYSWSNNTSSTTNTTSVQISALIANTYSVTITDANNCKIITSITITEPGAISVPTFSTNNTTCGQSNGSATANSSGGSGNLIYSWSNGVSGFSVSGLSAGNYSVTVFDANGCTKSASTIIGSNGGPIVTAAVSSTINCNSGTGSATAIATGGSGAYSYSWSNGSNSQTATNLSATLIYTVTVFDGSACSSSSTVTLTEPAILSLNTSTLDASCANANGSASIIVSGGSSPYTYNWSNAASSQTNNNIVAGTYSVTITDSKGCSSSTSAVVKSINPGIINIVPAQQTILEGASVDLTVAGGVTYTWSSTTGLSCSNCATPTASPTTTTTYTITATDANGCIITAMITITVKPACIGEDSDIFIANIFSPNNDGTNDLLYIKGNGLTNIYWAIYDRWGNLLFEAFDLTHPWDGTKKGNPMETGTYVYYLKATCIKTNTEVILKGNVSMVR